MLFCGKIKGYIKTHFFPENSEYLAVLYEVKATANEQVMFDPLYTFL